MYSKLANVGISNNMLLSEAKQARLLNIFSLTWIHLSTIYLILDSIFGVPITSIVMHLINISFMSFLLFLSFKKKFFIAKLFWVYFAIFSICFYSVFAEPGHFIEYFTLFFPAASLCLFTQNAISYTTLPVAFVAFITPYFIIPVYSDQVTKNLGVGFIIGFMICVFLLVLYLKKENFKNETLLALERDKVLSDKVVLEHQQEELKKLNEFKSHFFVNLSHEIRTPLTLIKGYSDQIDFSKSKEENELHLRVIDAQLGEIKKITDNIIDLSRWDEKEMRLNKQLQFINVFLTQLFHNFEALFQQKGIDFTLKTLANDIQVLFDYDLVQRSLSNILSNALKFTPQGGSVKLTASWKPNNGLCIRVTDTGIGIASGELTKIFERFFQVKNDITQSQGSGIGLAFTQSVIQAHGFKITATSEVDQGTEFTILIPKNALKINQDITTPTTLQEFPRPLENHKKTILLVDDYPQMRLYIKNLLQAYEVIEAAHGAEALAILKHTTIDLLLTDYMMPVMDGWTLVKNIKAQNYQFPVIVITARTDNEGKLAMLRLGIDNYFTKPFYKEELIFSINKALKYYDTLKNETLQTSVSELKNTEKLPQEGILFRKKITEIVTMHISDYNFGVEEMANLLETSSKTLTRKTKRYFGQTPNQIIIEARLLKAKQILDINNHTSLKEVARQIGMKNSSYLKKRFEARFHNSGLS